MLCKKLSELGLAAPDASDLFVVFISNPNRQVSFQICMPGFQHYFMISLLKGSLLSS
jgi:hypothetical protein